MQMTPMISWVQRKLLDTVGAVAALAIIVSSQGALFELPTKAAGAEC